MDVSKPKKKKSVSPGVCYLGRIPPRMDHKVVRHMLSPYGELDKIYLVPRNPSSAQTKNRDRPGKHQTQSYSERWVEFKDKRVAKRVAGMLNGEKIGGKKRSAFYYDLWNIKYLSKFKWDDLTGEIAYKNAEREQKLALEISAAKKEQEFYLSKVDMSRKLNAIDERMKKNQSCVSPSYMAQQQDINEKMRAILIDWFIEVYDKFEVMDETLFLTINLIDRFLERQVVVRKKLQLVGVTAMLLACDPCFA